MSTNCCAQHNRCICEAHNAAIAVCLCACDWVFLCVFLCACTCVSVCVCNNPITDHIQLHYSCTFVLHCLLLRHNPPILGQSSAETNDIICQRASLTVQALGEIKQELQVCSFSNLQNTLFILQEEREHRKGYYKMVCLCSLEANI